MVPALCLTLYGGSEVRRHAHLLQHDVERRVAVEPLDLAIPHVEEIRARNVDLGACGLDHAGGRFHRATKGSLNGQFNGEGVAHDIDPVKFAGNVGKHLGEGDHDLFEVLASIGRFAADVVKHAILGEATAPSGEVLNVSLGRVVGVSDDGLVVVGH